MFPIPCDVDHPGLVDTPGRNESEIDDVILDPFVQYRILQAFHECLVPARHGPFGE